MNRSKTPAGLSFLLILMMTTMPLMATDQIGVDEHMKSQDTTKVLTLDEFYKIILTHHPVVKQAELLGKMAQQEIRLARGSFDPKIVSSLEHKEFEDKTYYSKLDAYLSFPTWFPVNPKVGYEQNTGALLNGEDRIPGGNQVYAGVSVPIGKGLVTDERRTAVRQAALFKDVAVADQIKVINKTLLEAAKDYWHWYYAYNHYRLTSQAVTVAEDIYKRTRLNLEQGEAAVIDTVQTQISLQSRFVEKQEALLAFQNAGIRISNYLWDESGNPLQLGLSVAPTMTPADPAMIQDDLLEDLVERARTNHPELVKIKAKLGQLELDRSLAKEWLKPQLDFNYSMLSQPSAVHQIDPLNDYKIGVDLSFPVFIRKERSKLALAKMKIDQTHFQKSQLEREIINEVNTTFNELKNTVGIVQRQQEVVNLYQRLLHAELMNLENGETDLFKINIQQEKLIQSQSKLIKLTADLQKQKATLYWSAGVTNLNID